MCHSHILQHVLHMLFDSLGNGLGLLLFKEFIGGALGRHPHTDFKVTKLSPCPNQRQSHKTWHQEIRSLDLTSMSLLTQSSKQPSHANAMQNPWINTRTPFFRMPLSRSFFGQTFGASAASAGRRAAITVRGSACPTETTNAYIFLYTPPGN